MKEEKMKKEEIKLRCLMMAYEISGVHGRVSHITKGEVELSGARILLVDEVLLKAKQIFAWVTEDKKEGSYAISRRLRKRT